MQAKGGKPTEVRKLSIIVPVYNEEKLIEEVLERIESVSFPKFISEKEIILIDDCSSDNTNAVIMTLIETRFPACKLIKHEVNQGKGAAVASGIAHSNGDLIIIQDADLELLPEDIPLMVHTLHSLNIEFVNGSRYMPGIIRPLYSYKRYFFNRIFTMMTSVFINVRLSDVTCGYKLFTRDIYNQVKLKENRFGFEAELLIKVARLKKTLIAEVPVHYFPRNVGDGKKIRNTDVLRIFWVIVKFALFRMA